MSRAIYTNLRCIFPRPQIVKANTHTHAVWPSSQVFPSVPPDRAPCVRPTRLSIPEYTAPIGSCNASIGFPRHRPLCIIKLQKPSSVTPLLYISWISISKAFFTQVKYCEWVLDYQPSFQVFTTTLVPQMLHKLLETLQWESSSDKRFFRQLVRLPEWHVEFLP